MELRFQDWFTNILGVQSVAQFGAKQIHVQDAIHPSDIDCSSFFNTLPASHLSASVIHVKDNLAVVPDDWNGGSIITSWLNTRSSNGVFVGCMAQLKQADFVAFNDDFLKFIGNSARMEKVQSFEGDDANHVHEAPVFLPDTGDFVFADTSVVGWLYSLNVNTNKIRRVSTQPPLHNVNGGTFWKSNLYLTTNGGTAPGIYSCNPPSKAHGISEEQETINCSPVVNNHRLNHLNSPNDLIFISSGNIIFTDPTYGWAQSWPGVGPPELPTAVYHLNMKTKALVVLEHDVLQPNGLALSADEKTFYVADSNSTSGKPIGVWEDSVRSVFAFDFDESNLKLRNRRLVHMVERGWPDGIRVTQRKDGRELLLVASMGGVDVVDVSKGGAGILLGKFNVGDDIIFNLEPIKGKSARGGSSKEDSVWLLTGKKGVYKVSVAAG